MAKALEDFKKAIELAPDNGDIYNDLGYYYYYSGEETDACANWLKASELGNAAAKEMHKKYCANISASAGN